MTRHYYASEYRGIGNDGRPRWAILKDGHALPGQHGGVLLFDDEASVKALVNERNQNEATWERTR